MARGAILPISTLDAGEWAPELWGRFDLEKFMASLRYCLNFIPLTHGPITRRPGTRFVAATKGDLPARLIPFEVSVSAAYIIEATANAFRFYRDRGRLESPPGTPVEVATPYAYADLAQVKWAQSADVLYLAQPKYQPRKLTRTSATAFNLALLDFRDGPYLDQNTTTTTLTLSAATGSGITVTASSIVGINGGVGFQATDVGRLIRIKHASTWGYLKITAFTSTTVVTADVKANFAAATPVATWRLGAWSDTTGWPTCCTFHEERLVFGGTTLQPQTFWMSVAGDYENFAPSDTAGLITADSAISWTIADDRVNVIRWMSAGKVLNIGTAGGEFTVQASSLNEGITPTNITVRREGTIGSADIDVLRLGRSVIHVQRAGRKLVNTAYAFDKDAWVSDELSLLWRHLARRGIKELAYQKEPWSIIWMVMNDNSLVGFTYLENPLKMAAHQHPLTGTGVKVLSVATIPGNGQDELWLVVERTINGVTKRYVEYMEYERFAANADDKADYFFVDSGLTYAGAPNDVMSGLGHLEGETVSIWADGATHPTRQVVGGQVTLARQASKVQIGLGYTSRASTQSLDVGSGTATGRPQRIDEVVVLFLDTLGGYVGRAGAQPNSDGMQRIEMRRGSDKMDQSPPLFSGPKKVQFPNGWTADNGAIVDIIQDSPGPMTVLAMLPKLSQVA